MPHANDCIMTKLPGPGTVQDRVYTWLATQGATAVVAVQDRWHIYWDSLTTPAVPAGQFNDRMVNWLKREGATGEAYGDLWQDYWCNVHV